MQGDAGFDLLRQYLLENVPGMQSKLQSYSNLRNQGEVGASRFDFCAVCSMRTSVRAAMCCLQEAEPFDLKMQQDIVTALEDRQLVLEFAELLEVKDPIKILTARDKLVWALSYDFGRCQHGFWQHMWQHAPAPQSACGWTTVWDRWADVVGAPEMHWHHWRVGMQAAGQQQQQQQQQLPRPRRISKYRAAKSLTANYWLFDKERKERCVHVCKNHHDSYH
jgi:hypothetical protein